MVPDPVRMNLDCFHVVGLEDIPLGKRRLQEGLDTINSKPPCECHVETCLGP